MTSFIPRAGFPVLDSLPRSYFLGHHAAGLAKIRTLLNQIDLVIECRDYRVPLTSRNPLFEETLAGRQRVIVYTKKDLVSCSPQSEQKRHSLLQRECSPSPAHFSGFDSSSTRKLLDMIKAVSRARASLTASHCMVIGMPNVGKSTMLNALRNKGVGKGKAAHTGAQPGITRSIGTGVKIVKESEEEGFGGMYLLDTPGVFIPYVPDAEAMLKLALCGSVKDTVIPAFTLADYLLYHINQHDPEIYAAYHTPTNEVLPLLEAMAQKTGRLQKGGDPDLDATAMWMIQRWRNGHLGRFLLDNLSEESLEQTRAEGKATSLNQARKAVKNLQRERARAKAKRGDAGD